MRKVTARELHALGVKSGLDVPLPMSPLELLKSTICSELEHLYEDDKAMWLQVLTEKRIKTELAHKAICEILAQLEASSGKGALLGISNPLRVSVGEGTNQRYGPALPNEGGSLNGKTRTSLEGIRGSHSSSPEGIRGSHSTSPEGIRGSHSTSQESIWGSESCRFEGIRGSHSSSLESIRGSHSTSLEGIPESERCRLEIKALDRLVDERYYPNRAEAIRVAIRDLLAEEVWNRGDTDE